MEQSPLSFVPGPAHVRPEVLAAMARPPLPHRSAAFEEILVRVQRGLGTMLSTREPVAVVLASATTSIEAALRGIARRRLLVPAAGSFGQRLAKIGRAIGLETEELTLPHGEAVDADTLDRALSLSGFDTVAVVHSETSTGALSDVAALASVVQDHPGVALVVDAVSSFGGVEIAFDDLGPDTVLVSATSKALACPPGLSVMAVGPGAAERAGEAKNAGHALSLTRIVEAHAKGSALGTPGTPLIYALDVQLAHILEEGMPARAARHREMAQAVQAWAEDRFAVVAAPRVRCPTVTAVENTRALDVPDLLRRVERRGYRIANGYGPLRDATFRIGHLGDVTPADVAGLLAVLEEETRG